MLIRNALLLAGATVLVIMLSCAPHRSRAELGSPSAGPAAGQTRAAATGWSFQGLSIPSWTDEGYLEPSVLAALDGAVALNARWVAIIPHWFMKTYASTAIEPDLDRYAATDESVRHVIQQARARGLKVMLKPHVNAVDGVWRGNIKPEDPAAWFESYRVFLLHYARLAAEMGAELLCVSTELRSMTGPAYTAQWRSLVAEVRGVYSGQLTAAGNWGRPDQGEYYAIQWWDALDYIGVNAYFPLTREAYPTAERVMEGWRSYTDTSGQTGLWVDDLRALSQRLGRQVIFTEIGFDSAANPGAEWDEHTGFDLASQKNCVEATFEVFSREPWMAGAFWWEWGIGSPRGSSPEANMVLNDTPAAESIAHWYAHGTARPTGGSAAAWENVGQCTKIWISPDIRYQDKPAVGVWSQEITRETPGYVRIPAPAEVRPGYAISARVYVGGSAEGVFARIYAQEPDWTWVAVSHRTPLAARTWTPLRVELPADTPMPLRYLGIEITAAEPGFTGPVYVDDIAWGPQTDE